MDYLRFVASTAQLALAKGSGIPNLPNFGLGEKDTDFEGLSIWTLYEGTKRDDDSPVSIFVFDVNAPSSSRTDRKSLLPLARNAFRKLRALRHPDIIRFVDGSETDSAVYIVTEKVVPLTSRIGREGDIKPDSQSAQETGTGEEWRIWGLSKVVNALGFINDSGQSTHANLKVSSVFVTPSGEWKLGGFEVLSTTRDPAPVLFTHGGLVPESAKYASPEVRRSGYEALKELDAHAFDAYLLLLFIHVLFNGPVTHSLPSTGEPPAARGNIPPSIFPHARRLFPQNTSNPNSRLKPSTFHALGNAIESPGGFFRTNRLVVLADGLGNFALAGEGERAALIKSIRDGVETAPSTKKLPAEFLKWKVLPELAKAFELGPGGPQLLPLIIALGESGGLTPDEYEKHVGQPIVRMFASPDRAMRMALLDNLPKFVDKLDNRTVVDKMWPQLQTGFGDVVPVIREATVKSVLLLAPKLSDRILNNELLRHLAKTQTDSEPGIRTNTCILLGRLSKFLSASTSSKVLIPAFSRALRDPFVHARMAGLMSLMATVEIFNKEDLAGRIIPCMSHTLVDKEKIVRDQGFKAIDMFVKRAESLIVGMPETALPLTPSGTTSMASAQQRAVESTQPGLATSAAGAAGALAGWAFNSMARKLAPADLQTGISGQSALPSQDSPARTPSAPPPTDRRIENIVSPPRANSFSATKSTSSNSLDQGDWGGDLMDVNADADDWDSFEVAPVKNDEPAAPSLSTLSTKPKLRANPLSTKPPPPRSANTNKHAAASTGGSMKLGGSLATKENDALKALENEMDDDAGWDIDAEGEGSAPPSSVPSRTSTPASGHWNDVPDTHFKTNGTSAGAKSKSSIASKARAARKTVAAANDDSWGMFDEAAQKTEAEENSSWGSGNDWGSAPPPAKEDPKARMARMREERKARLAAMKGPQAPVSTPPPAQSSFKAGGSSSAYKY